MRIPFAWGFRMLSFRFSIHGLGWRCAQADQLTPEDFESCVPARVSCVERTVLTALTERGEVSVEMPLGTEVAVGDWILLDAHSRRFARMLDAATRLVRVAAGTETRRQVIAANVDTLFVVTSCNEDFNPSRLERYLTLAHEGRIEPVIVLTKVDLSIEGGTFIERAAQIAPGIQVIALNALAPTQVASLLPWLQCGHTAAFVGSSGVGKSTLVNSLTNAGVATSAIREQDAKGRHTTTSRHMFEVPSGGWIIDTPGMRELRIGAAEAGIRATFDDVEQLARACRFRDCSHEGNAGCAVREAIERGRLSQRRFDNYTKLRREALYASESVHERRERDRRFGRMAKGVLERRKWERNQT